VSDFIEIMGYDEIADGQMHAVEIEEHDLLVYKVDGDILITDGRCPHMHGDLAKGTLEGTVVTCPRHGSQFDVRDGHVVRWTEFEGVVKSVAQFVKHPRPLRTYESRVEDGKVFVGPEREPRD
jgi:3-phenylpropionate/trans-cinnamate dioxygenase ferredoxin subunit